MASRPRHHADRFPVVYDGVAGSRRRFRTVTCDKCHYGARVMENTTAPLPVVMVAKKFIARGWSLNGMNVCPRCKAGKKPMSPAARRAAYCAINNVSGGKPMAAAAEAPRMPTAEERRRIREALETHYDEDAARYRQSWSDKALGAKLDLPVAWVTDLREAGGYGPNVNEAGAQRAADVENVKLEIANLQTEILSRFDDLEAKLRKLLGPEGV